MVFFDLAGLVLGAIAFALVWAADMALGPASEASPILAAWATLVCLAGLVTTASRGTRDCARTTSG